MAPCIIIKAACSYMEENDIMVKNLIVSTECSTCVGGSGIVSGVHEDSFVREPLMDKKEAFVNAEAGGNVFWDGHDEYGNAGMKECDGQDLEVVDAGDISMVLQEKKNGVGAVEAEWDDNDAMAEELEDSEGDEWSYDQAKKKTNERKIKEACQNIGGGDGDNDNGTERFMVENRVKVARFGMTKVEVYERKIADLKKKLDNVLDGFRAAAWERDRWRLDHSRSVDINFRLQSKTL